MTDEPNNENPQKDETPGPPPLSRKRRALSLLRGASLPVALLVLGAGAVVSLAMLLPSRQQPEGPEKNLAVDVAIEQVALRESLADTFNIPGVVEPARIVTVAAETSARIDAYAGRKDTLGENFTITPGPARAGVLEEGDAVVAGQPLVYLNRDLVEAEYRQTKAEYEYQQREYARLLNLFERNVATKSELDTIKKIRDKTRALLDVQRARMERLTVVAPIAGTLNSLPAEVGEFVGPGQAVAQIVDMETVKVVVDVPEKDIGYLSIGQNATVTSARGKVIRRGEITYISELADPAARTTRVEITVQNKDRAFRSGRIVDVQLTRRVLEDIIMVPLRAIIPMGPAGDRPNTYAAYVVEDNTAQRKDVTLDPSLYRNSEIRVTAGLTPGDKLILEPHLVGPGEQVAIRTRETPSASALTPATGAASQPAPAPPTEPADDPQ
jgi:membrane fusion protein, multidrug efflux system